MKATFLNLPAEVRVKILEYLLKSERTIVLRLREEER